MYASFLGFCAPYIWTFLNSLFKMAFFIKLLDIQSRIHSIQRLTGIVTFMIVIYGSGRM